MIRYVLFVKSTDTVLPAEIRLVSPLLLIPLQVSGILEV